MRIIPVLLDGTRTPKAEELPPSLRALARRQAVTLSPANFDTRRLAAVFEAALSPADSARPAPERTPETVPPVRPHADYLLMDAVRDATVLSSAEQKASALMAVIRAAVLVTPEQVGWLATEAENAARSIEDVHERSPLLSLAAQATAAANPDYAAGIARSIEDASERSSALASVARTVAATDPERAQWLAAEAEATVRSIEGPVSCSFNTGSRAGRHRA